MACPNSWNAITSICTMLVRGHVEGLSGGGVTLKGHSTQRMYGTFQRIAMIAMYAISTPSVTPCVWLTLSPRREKWFRCGWASAGPPAVMRARRASLPRDGGIAGMLLRCVLRWRDKERAVWSTARACGFVVWICLHKVGLAGGGQLTRVQQTYVRHVSAKMNVAEQHAFLGWSSELNQCYTQIVHLKADGVSILNLCLKFCYIHCNRHIGSSNR